MSILKKISFHYEDREEFITGNELNKWLFNFERMTAWADVENNNFYVQNPINWSVVPHDIAIEEASSTITKSDYFISSSLEASSNVIPEDNHMKTNSDIESFQSGSVITDTSNGDVIASGSLHVPPVKTIKKSSGKTK